MITRWKVSNFKSIREETDLVLAPLTIFAGANSSGKSTFIQSVLLVAQTLAHKVGSRPVVLNGAFASLGQFDDLKSNGSKSDQITIKCTCQPISDEDSRTQKTEPYATRHRLLEEIKKVACEISFGTDPSSSQRDLLQIQPRLFTTLLSCVFRDEETSSQDANISISYSNEPSCKKDSNEKTDDQLDKDLHYDVNLDEDSMDEIKERYTSAKPIGCRFQHFLPQQIICDIDRIREDAIHITRALQYFPRRVTRRRMRTNRINTLSNEIIDILRDVLQGVINLDDLLKEKLKQKSLFGEDFKSITLQEWNTLIQKLSIKDRQEVRRKFLECDNLPDRIYEAIKNSGIYKSSSHKTLVQLPDQIIEASMYLDNFFSSHFRYLGPLRDSPKLLYPIAPVYEPDDIGLQGENTASVLETHKRRKVTYIPSSSFKSSNINPVTKTEMLEKAVTNWLEYLGVASSVRSKDRGKLGHELKVKTFNSDGVHDLTHVGVGVSQVLPILVMCLLSDRDSTLVFEQPELHLHPKVQTLLGDFFFSMALCNKQCIVETHSEYLINRMRFRIAATSSENKLADKIKIYFVEKTSQGSSFREVVVNEYGAISDWPEGFFDQSQKQSEELLRAATMKRKNGRRNTDS